MTPVCRIAMFALAGTLSLSGCSSSSGVVPPGPHHVASVRSDDEWTARNSLVPDSNNQHVAYVRKSGAVCQVVVDDDAGPEWSWIGLGDPPAYRLDPPPPLYDAKGFRRTMTFGIDILNNPFDPKTGGIKLNVAGDSDQGLALQLVLLEGLVPVYVAKSDAGWHFVSGAQRLGPFLAIRSTITASHDSRAAACVVETAKGLSVASTRGLGSAHRSVSPPVFGPNGELAYLGQDGDRAELVVDGNTVDSAPGWEIRGGLFFSRTVEAPAWTVGKEDQVALVIKGHPGPSFDEIVTEPKFLPVSQSPVYGARKSDGFWVVAGDRKFGPYQKLIDVLTPSQGSDGFVYVARTDKGDQLFSQGEPVATGEKIENTSIGPDGRRVAFEIHDQGMAFVELLEGGQPQKRFGPYENVLKTAFSPDGSRLVFIAERGNQAFVAEEGHEQRPYFDIVQGPVFSEDSGRLGYFAQKGKDTVVCVVDGVESGEYSDLVPESLVFSPGGKHYGFVAITESNDFAVVLDGVPHNHPSFVRGSKITFTGPDTVHYLAGRSGDEIRVFGAVLGSGRPQTDN